VKKYIFGLFFLSCLAICYGQENINEYISYLDRPVPRNFQRVDRTNYMDNTGNIILSIENNLVKACSIGVAFAYNHEASEWLAFYYNYFEDNNWEYVNISNMEIYIKDNVYAIIGSSKRDDGQIVSMIMFTKDFEWVVNNL
jgi:hypothetical protein